MRSSDCSLRPGTAHRLVGDLHGSLADPTFGLEDLQNAVERFADLSSGEVDRVEQAEEWPIGRRLFVTSLDARLALMSKAGSAAMPGPASGTRPRRALPGVVDG
jgi:hypothetical protein